MNANLKEALRWIRQADKDLNSAKNSLKAGDYEWSCFQAQQSAEKVEDAEECLNYAELILEEVKKFIKK